MLQRMKSLNRSGPTTVRVEESTREAFLRAGQIDQGEIAQKDHPKSLYSLLYARTVFVCMYKIGMHYNILKIQLRGVSMSGKQFF